MIKNLFIAVGALSIMGTTLLNAAEPLAVDAMLQERLEKLDMG